MRWSAIARWTTLAKVVCLTVFSVGLFSGPAMGQLLGPSDIAIAIDEDGDIPVGSSYPAGESPAHAIDGDPLAGDPPLPQRTKYLNFGGAGTGFIVSPLLGLPVESFQIRTGNDAPGRDPASWELYGTDVALLSADNSMGTAEMWTLIDSGSIPLTADPIDLRSELLPPVDVNLGGVGGAGFTHYKMVFPTVRTAGNIFQMGEIQFYDADNATGNPILTPGDPILAINNRVAPNSSYPAAESPARGIDQIATTKYLNFGEERSGLIITNSEGPIEVNYMRITTANDAVERDPTSYELYGTNDPIQSTEHSTGNGGELWTLISSGPLSLPDTRFDGSTVVPVNSPASYTSYKLIFPTVKNAEAANSMQIADVQFATEFIPEPSTVALLAMGLAAVAVSRRRHG